MVVTLQNMLSFFEYGSWAVAQCFVFQRFISKLDTYFRLLSSRQEIKANHRLEINPPIELATQKKEIDFINGEVISNLGFGSSTRHAFQCMIGNNHRKYMALVILLSENQISKFNLFLYLNKGNHVVKFLVVNQNRTWEKQQWLGVA